MNLIHLAAHLAGIGIERKNMEAALLDSRNELQQVTNSISDSVWSADVSAEGEVTLRYSSHVVQRLAGRPPEFFMESPEGWLSVVHPEDRVWVRQRLGTSTKTLTAAPEAEYRIVMPDGTIRWIRDSIRSTPLENGGMRMHGVLSDITARKQAEEAFRQSQELLQNVLDGSMAVIYVKDLEGHYLLANRRISELCRLSREAIIGKTDYDLFPREQATELRRADWQALASGGPVEVEETITGADHQQHAFIAVKTVLRDKSGKPYAVCGISTDITERKRLEEQLREAQKMEAIGKLAGGIAHDFNNLMTIVTGYSELLQSALEGDPNLAEKAAEIHKAGEQAASLTRQLLAFSRRQVIQKKLLNLNEVLSSMSSMMRRLLQDDIELQIVQDPALALVRGDSAQFQQIIMNLIINARDAMPNGGRIMLSTANAICDKGDGLHEPCVRIMVRDTGYGIPPEIREHIFEPFFTTKEQGRGTGLGLATVHGVVQQAGGHVAVESEPGQGTTFYLYLPTAEGEVSPEPLVMPAPERGSESILVVEDQEGLRTLIIEILRKHGYDVLAASNGRDALRVLEKADGRIDMMITDLVMPQMGGRALAAALPDFHPETRVVYMSGYVENLEELLAPGHEFIEKPFTPDLLLRRVRELLDKRSNLARPA
jgi:PAS domain S-box-containing protein